MTRDPAAPRRTIVLAVLVPLLLALPWVRASGQSLPGGDPGPEDALSIPDGGTDETPPDAGDAARRDAARTALKQLTKQLLKNEIERGGETLKKIAEAQKTIKDAKSKATLAKEVYDYAMVVRKIDNDMRNIENLVNNCPDTVLKAQWLAAYMETNPGHDIVNYNHVVQIVFGGASVGVGLAAEFGKTVVGGEVNALIGAAELGVKLMNAAKYLDPGSEPGPEAIKKLVDERVVEDEDGKQVVLTEAQASWVAQASGGTLQERFENTYIVHNGSGIWLTPEMRKRLDDFAMKRNLDPQMGWRDVYGLYLEAKTKQVEIDEDKRLQDFLKEEARKFQVEQAKPAQPAAPPQQVQIAAPAESACFKSEQQLYQNAVNWFPKIRNPNSFAHFSCEPMHSAQWYSPKACCDAYYATRNQKGMWENAWYVLQECSWKVETESRRQALEKKKAECLKAPAR